MIDLNQQKELISKGAILKYYTDLEIYQKYIDEEIKIGSSMLSPLRKESRPSFGFFIGRSNEICFKDYLLGAGDCIRFVQMKFNLTYFEALSQIAHDFNLADDYICKSLKKTTNLNNTSVPSRDELLSKVIPLKITKTSRPFQLHDALFWEGFGISRKTLQHFNVQAISHFHINDRTYVADKHAYCFIEVKDNIETYKIYQPFNDTYKWINGHNDSVWQGWTMLPEKGTDLIITKSLKDVMSIYENTGLPAISLQSENVLPKRHVFEQLNKRFETCYLLYDNDFDKDVNWGQQFAEKLAVQLGLINIFIDDKYKSKDFSDLIKNTSREQAREILTNQMMIPF